MRARIEERGLGFPNAGDHVMGTDAGLYRVEAVLGPILTGWAGVANYVYADVTTADWRDCPAGAEFPAICDPDPEGED